jgi:hypothetical protein
MHMKSGPTSTQKGQNAPVATKSEKALSKDMRFFSRPWRLAEVLI